jgi:UPF0755 protein
MRRIFLFFLILALLTGAVYYIYFLNNPNVSDREVIVGIPQGTTVAMLTDTLAAHHLLRSRFSFQIAARTLGAAKDLHAGLYRIAPGLSNVEIIRRLTGSEFALVLRTTFPEGITIYHAASIAKEKLGLDSGIFIRFALDTAFLHSLGIPEEAKTAEGYLFPDTYEFLLRADPKALLTKMIRHWKKLANDSLYEQSDNEHLSLHEVMTLASIVEAEAKLPQERDTIASVYLNRLRIGMKLDADPTVQYGEHLSEPITHDDLLTPTPYNTYMNAGLPPGPICSPGVASIRAVLHPAVSQYLYFVARRDGSGGHYFSKSLAEQDRKINMARANAAQE